MLYSYVSYITCKTKGASVVNTIFSNCRLVNTTTLDMGLNNSKREDSTSQMETNTSEPHSNMNKIIISVVYVVVIVTVVIGIIGFAFYKRLCKNTGNFKIV